MIPSFLITFREAIEAALIVATLIGILTKLNQRQGVRVVWLATFFALLASTTLLIIGSIIGTNAQGLLTDIAKERIEGILMIVSACFITWAVFFLHTFFASYKLKLLRAITTSIGLSAQRGLFWLAFTAVFREGFEIVLFLSTTFFSTTPFEILFGSIVGLLCGVAISVGLFTATVKLSVLFAFRVSSLLLILFSASMLANGVSTVLETGFFPHISFISPLLMSMYTGFMIWWVFLRNKPVVQTVAEPPQN